MKLRPHPRLLAIAMILATVVSACTATAEVTAADLPDRTIDRTPATAETDESEAGGGPSNDESAVPQSDEEPSTDQQRVDAGVDERPNQDSSQDDNPFADPIAGGGVDFRLTRDDVDCDEDNLGSTAETPFVVAHVVVDGNLGEPCFGEPDERLTHAWQVLAAITPAGQLSDLALFGGYVSLEKGETTLAFVNIIDIDASIYQMSINLDEAEADPDELMLTMAHEFTHVFTNLPSQIDRFTFPEDCATWDNGEGCYLEDSLMWEWVQLFWGDGLIDQIDPYRAPSNFAGEERCNLNPGFLGTYAASYPEEDFAESFSAFVFQLEVPSPELQAKMEWFAQQPGLAEFRMLAIEAGFGPLRNDFDECG